MPMNIREYRKADYGKVLESIINFQTYIHKIDTDTLSRDFENKQEAEGYLNQLLDDVEKREGYFYVAEESGKVVGFIVGIIERYSKDSAFYYLTHTSGDIGWIGVIYVNDEFRGRGVAQELITMAKEYLASNGCKRIKLLVLDSNKTAVNVYQKLGFQTHDIEMVLDIEPN
jgi:ribosomal protein S18 acetylase RimI-like enzyme